MDTGAGLDDCERFGLRGSSAGTTHRPVTVFRVIFYDNIQKINSWLTKDVSIRYIQPLNYPTTRIDKYHISLSIDFARL